ncbi:MAG: hypothetical protein JRN15_08200 [Nitrososphaerota archaeon]|nr:hypothetical protein [Nitrososphaerota archaeon]
MIQFNDFLPVFLLDYTAIVLVLIVAFGIVYKLRKWLRTIPSGLFHEASSLLGGSKLALLFFSELGNRVIGQRNLITDSKVRWITHFLVFWGFVGLGVATVWDDIFYHQGALPAPFSFSNPGNIIGNVAGAMALIGTTGMVGRYLFVNKYKNSGRGDVVFFVTLYIAIITGFVTEFARYSGAQLPTFVSYSIHLAFVAILLGSAPFTHFFHAILTPFMRYVERLRISIQNKKGPYFIGDRYSEMSKISEHVRSGQVEATKPTWLRKNEDPDSQKS